MLISTSPYMDGLTVIRFRSRRLRADALRFVDLACDQSERKARFGVLLDFSGVKSASMSTIGALVEVLCRHPRMDFAFCALNEKLKQLVNASGMDRHLNTFTTTELALRSDLFCRHFLTSTRAILNLPHAPGQIAKATGSRTIAELDILGRPLIEHFLANLTDFGLKEALICASKDHINQLKPILEDIDHNMCLFFVQCQLQAVNTLQQEHGSSRNEFTAAVCDNFPASQPVLMSGIDGLRRLKARHLERLLNTRASTESSRFPPLTNPHLDQEGFRFVTADQLFPEATPKPETVVPLTGPSREMSSNLTPRCNRGHRISSLATYFSTLQLASKRITTSLLPHGEEIAHNLWRAKGANLSPRARINGFCYLSENATIEPEAALKSFTLVGRNATVDRRALLNDCVVLPWSKTAQNQSFQQCFIGAQRRYSLASQPGQQMPMGTLGPAMHSNNQKLGVA